MDRAKDRLTDMRHKQAGRETDGLRDCLIVVVVVAVAVVVVVVVVSFVVVFTYISTGATC